MATSAVQRNVFEAGRAGKDVRSDLHVAFEPRESGGVEIELVSRVAAYYGNSIREQAEQALEQLGVKHARLVITDEGALPFVIDARIEAAVKRAGLGDRRRVLPRRRTAPAGRDEQSARPATAKDRMRRSRMYLPGNEPKYFINAGLHEPDAVILDLEDSVHHAEKDAARLLVRNALRVVDFGACERMVRINQLPLGSRDIEEVAAELPDVILIPKVETAEQVVSVDAEVRKAVLHARHDGHVVWLMPIIESALGVENAFEIARASDRVCAITIGLEDFTSDLGVQRTASGTESLYARQRIVNAAKAAGVQAIDSVFSDVADENGLRAWGRQSYAMGFEGMGCIHPAQIPIIHECYAPNAKEIEKARAIVAAFDEAQARGLGVVSLGSKMIDAPVVQSALKMLARAQSTAAARTKHE
jgi:citrate lyase subunit beta / citryl-CoA lyase